MIETVLLFVVSLVVVIVAHELGHFLVAKRMGVAVEEFGIGFPPRLYGREWRGTLYSVNALPVGAFVKSRAESDPDVEGSLASKGPLTRFAVYAAGPGANIVLAFLLLTVFFGLPRGIIVSDGVLIYEVQANSAAEQAGLQPGDVLVEAGGHELETWGDLQDELATVDDGEAVSLIVSRDGGTPFATQLTPRYSETLERRVIGVTLGHNVVDTVVPGSLASDAGVLSGDTLLGVDGEGIVSESTFREALSVVNGGEAVVLTLLHEGEAYTIDVAGDVVDPAAIGLGLNWAPNTRVERRALPLWTAAASSVRFVVSMPAMIVASIPLMQEDPSLAFVGPIGAGQLTVEAVRAFGPSNLIFIGGLISIGIALFNLFPVPPLDGGGMLVALVEWARRGRRLSEKSVRMAYAIGTALLITLVVFITTSDILRLIEGRGFGI
ncbi:RIP metalloprotease RseP [Chloroflexota bacterium]